MSSFPRLPDITPDTPLVLEPIRPVCGHTPFPELSPKVQEIRMRLFKDRCRSWLDDPANHD